MAWLYHNLFNQSLVFRHKFLLKCIKHKDIRNMLEQKYFSASFTIFIPLIFSLIFLDMMFIGQRHAYFKTSIHIAKINLHAHK